jgi:glycosyltransferase involved in cell wall biosynthesis
MKKLSILYTEARSCWEEQASRIYSELEGFHARGHVVALVAQPTSEIFKRSSATDIPVEAIAMNYSNVPQAIWRVMRIIHKRKVDIVNTHTSRDHWIGSIAARLSKRQPIVIRMQYHSSLIRKGFLRRLMYQKLSDHVITTGATLKKQLITERYFLSDRIASVPTGVDLARFDSGRYDLEMMRNALGHTNGPLIAITGVFTSGETFQDSIAAAAEVLKIIPKTKFYIVGTGLPAEVKRARTVISQYRLQNEVSILGYPEDSSQILSAMDLLIHCSSDNLDLPHIILQALAMGKPIVATKVGAIPEIVFDGVTGYLVPPRDVQSLADRVTELLQDELKRKAFGQAGRRLAREKFSLENMLDRIEQLYQSLLSMRERMPEIKNNKNEIVFK